jgi:hypothetical protein
MSAQTSYLTKYIHHYMGKHTQFYDMVTQCLVRQFELVIRENFQINC